MSNDTLGDRIKFYENAFRAYLPNKFPIILRLDGKGFSQLTAKIEKPFDQKLIDALNETALYLCKNIQGVKISYLQSDEMTFLIYNDDFISQGWFGNNIQKMVSISAAMASSYFTSINSKVFGEAKLAQFDARVFLAPIDEVTNVFEWRQQDCSRNSIQSMARSLYSHKECTNKNLSELQELIHKSGKNWNNLATALKLGRCCVKEKYMKEEVERSRWTIDNEIPIFSQNRNYIDQYVLPADEDASE